MDKQKALSKCMQLCSKREYCVFDISERLQKWEIQTTEIEEIINVLIANKFIDNKRYVSAFVNDKIKFNHWGKIKIRYYLQQKRIEPQLINNILTEFDNELYNTIAKEEISKKLNKTNANSAFELKNKVAQSIASKGFEPGLIFKILDELLQK